MAYLCNLDTGQTIYLENQGTQTIVTSIMTNLGQQQQSSSSIDTGNWTSTPEVFRTSNGVLLKIQATKGQVLIAIQGNQIQTVSQLENIGNLQQLHFQEISQTPIMPIVPPLQPMTPMQPMKMGNMEMKPMEMRLGNMSMSMQSSPVKKFCSQCGSSVKPEDKFCSSCGQKL